MTDSLLPTNPSGLVKARTFVALIVRTIGAYLGLAALVVVFLVLTVPALRQQVATLHSAVLVALAPEGFDASVTAIEFAGVAPQVKPVDLTSVPGTALAKLEPRKPPSSRPVIPRTDRVGLLGNIPLPVIDQAMAVFGVDDDQLKALEHYISRKYRVARSVVDRLVESAMVVGAELKVNPVLILAVMSIESRFNPYAESGVGAQGLMQVMTRVHTDKFEKLGQDQRGAFHPEVNIRVGTQILADCIRRRGSVVNGLKCYVGATGPDDGGYSDKVLAEMRRMALASKIKI